MNNVAYKSIRLPSFTWNKKVIDDSLEEYEISKNKTNLKKELRESEKSWLSNLVI